MDLTTLPNIGKTLADKLKILDIDTAEKLLEHSSEDVFLKIKTIDSTACINMLYAIEGAIQNIRWHGLSQARKKELLTFFKNLERQL